MAIVHIRINGRDYDIACDDGQEEQLRLLADEIDDRVRALVFGMGGNPGESMGLLLVALTMADELIESKREIEKTAMEIRRLRAQATAVREDNRMAEIEGAMAVTLEEIAARIEKIADHVEIH